MTADTIKTMSKQSVLEGGSDYVNDPSIWAKRFRGFRPGKRSWAVELAGIPGMGKTHIACTSPNPALGDTEIKGYRVAEKLGLTRYAQLRNWEELLGFCYHCILDPDVQSIVLDSSKDVVAYAEAHYLKEGGKKYEKNMWYSEVYAKVKELIHDIRVSEKNLLFTSRMTHTYVNGEQTEKNTEVSGYKNAWYEFDAQVILRTGVVISGKGYLPKQVIGYVTKNALTPPDRQVPYIIPEPGRKLDWDMITQELSLSLDNPLEHVVERLSKW